MKEIILAIANVLGHIGGTNYSVQLFLIVFISSSSW